MNYNEGSSSMSELRSDWERDGYLVLPGLISDEYCDAIVAEMAKYCGGTRAGLGSKITVDILQGEWSGRLLNIADVPDEAFRTPFKINNLFTESEVVRKAMFKPELRSVLANILGSEPVAINSLNFKYGSQQPAHIDSWYMPPPKDNSLVVASICLEDVDPEAGPLVYYPGSHLIPGYRFSHGGLNAVEEEMQDCRGYLDRELTERGLEPRRFLGKKGDVFIWHCQLLHGGSPILRSEKTRKSLVVHYWGADAVDPQTVLSFGPGESYLNRDYWRTDGLPLPAAPGHTSRANNETSVPGETISGEDKARPVNAHVAFDTWDIQSETLESVEARIHDGVSKGELHARARGYLETLDAFFPESRPPDGSVMMEIGSGVGYIMEAALHRYHPKKIVGLDVAAGMIAMAQRRFARDGVDSAAISFTHYDGIDMPFADESVDHIYSVASLQHAPRAYCFRALMEAHRVVKKGGAVRVHLLAHSHFRDNVTPDSFRDEVDRQVHNRPGHWHHYYGAEEIESVLEYGIGAADIKVKEHMGSLYIRYCKA